MTPLDENDYSVVVWVNPRAAAGSARAAYLASVVGERTGNPLARPTTALRGEPSLRRSPVMRGAEEIGDWLAPPGRTPAATRERPVIVPVPLARSVLGWEEFEVSRS